MSENFRRFWSARGGPEGFERWRLTGKITELLVRVKGDGFVAGFVIDDEARRCAPILRRWLAGKTEAEARTVLKQQGWTATVIA